MQGFKKFSGVMLAAVLFSAAASQAWAANLARLVIVHQGGRTQTMTLPDSGDRLAKAAGAACADAGVMFAFTEEPLPSASPVFHRADRTGTASVRVTLTCSALDPIGVELDYAVQAAGGQAGYIVNPLARVSLGAVGTASTAEFRIDILDSAGQADEQFGIRREGGQFSGAAQGVPVLGMISAGETPILAATITGYLLGSQPPDGMDGQVDDPWAPGLFQDLHRFCSAPERRNGPECQAMARMMAEGEMRKIIRFMRAVSTERATAIAPSSVGLMTTQVGNVAVRISQLLHGIGGGFNGSGLMLAGSGGTFSLGELEAVLKADEDPNEEKRTLLGGTRWGLWINGTVGGGEVTRHRGNSGFEFDNWSLTGGVDYRFTDAFFLGAAIGHSRLTSGFEESNDRLDANTRAFHLYGGYSGPHGLSLDASLSRVRSDFEMVRYLPRRGSQDMGHMDAHTRGSPVATQRAASLGVTWYLQPDLWTFAPMLQYQWIGSRVDAFEEESDSIFRLSYARQDVVTRSLSGGVYGDVTLATRVGTFRPYGRALWYRNGGSGARNLVAEFAEGGSPINSVVAAEPDRSYSTMELGLGFRRPIGTRTVDFNLGALKLFGYSGVDRWSVRGDVRIPF